MFASLLYKLPRPNFEADNVYIFEFQVGYVNLFFRKPLFKGLGEGELEEEKESSPSKEEVEEEEVMSGEELEFLGEGEFASDDDSEPQVSIGGKGEAEMEDDQWLDINLEALQINALTTEEEYKMIFMNGIEITSEANRVIVSNEVRAILHSLDKIKTTKQDIKAQIDLLNVHQGLLFAIRNEEVEREYEVYETSDNPAKHFAEPEGFFETLDLEDLPLPSVKKLKVSMALYDIKLIQVDEDRFMINMPREKTEMEEQEDTEIIYEVKDIKFIPVPQFPFDEENLSRTNITKDDLKNKCTYKAITSLRPQQMIERIKTVPLLIDISEHDRLATKSIKTIGMSRIGYLGNRFIDVIKANAEPNAPTPTSCVKDVILPIINNHGIVVGEIKVILKLKCYNKRAWPDISPRLPMTPSMTELLESEHIVIESIPAETTENSGDLSDEYELGQEWELIINNQNVNENEDEDDDEGY